MTSWGMVQRLELGVPCRIGGTEKGWVEEEFKGWGFLQDKEPGGVGG